jgi:hypothetical protein
MISGYDDEDDEADINIFPLEDEKEEAVKKS